MVSRHDGCDIFELKSVKIYIALCNHCCVKNRLFNDIKIVVLAQRAIRYDRNVVKRHFDELIRRWYSIVSTSLNHWKNTYQWFLALNLEYLLQKWCDPFTFIYFNSIQFKSKSPTSFSITIIVRKRASYSIVMAAVMTLNNNAVHCCVDLLVCAIIVQIISSIERSHKDWSQTEQKRSEIPSK